jgi:hypothetical protein
MSYEIQRHRGIHEKLPPVVVESFATRLLSALQP